MGKCAMGFDLPKRGPCKTCGAESDNTCGRWASAANDFINGVAQLNQDDIDNCTSTLAKLISDARRINGDDDEQG